MNEIKSKDEEVNNKYDVRKVYYLDNKQYDNLRFLTFKSASCFKAKLEGLKLI